VDEVRFVTRRIDAHHHVWALAARDQPWMVGDGMAPMRRDFAISEFVAEAEANSIDASVLVQAVGDITETEELLDLAAACPFVAGVVGWVDVSSSDVDDHLDRLLARPSGSWLVGIRSLVQYEPDPTWLSRPAVRAGLRAVARRGLCNELLVIPDQLDAVVSAISDVPESRFMLDHLAKPAIGTGAWQPWAQQLAAVATCANVSAKISGLVTEAQWLTWTLEDLRPYLDHALAEFGPDRLVFGSDWPVCTLAASYAQIVGIAESFVAGLSAGEQAAIFGGNATKVYALDTRGIGGTV
jgi:L-fuconolactonase